MALIGDANNLGEKGEGKTRRAKAKNNLSI
jgi:hypothetical protein